MMHSPSKDQPQGEQPLHCGKWTPEEEAYVQCLIEEFQAGYLPIREGTSLRNFLSKMLNCKPKRISKKFEGSDYNGKQVYASQPYKLTAEEARDRRDRLCGLEKKFHQSVAELKNVEGMKHQQEQGMGLGLDTDAIPGPPLAAAAASTAAASFSAGAGLQLGMPNDMTGGGGGSNSNSQYLEELAFQESMLRLRQQQQQQQQSQQQQQQSASAGLGGGNAGSYVDPILGSLSMSQNSMNTTPMAASQYWRRQALLDASSHMDSLRMAQAGAIGIQRPTLEPGGMRDLRVPANLMGHTGMPTDDLQQLQEGSGVKDVSGAGFKKRRGETASEDMAKRIRRTNEPEGSRPAAFF